jgi:glycosyltransferase involved in cell wall biosynthesis
MRYAWEMEAQYLKDFRIRGLLKRFVRGELKRLRRWDLATARRVDHFIANSTETQKRIKRIYGRESVIVSPPVDERFYQTPLTAHRSPLTPSSYFLAIGRLVPYKRFDLLIELANMLKLDLRIAGTGTDEARLKKLAGPTVHFLGFVADSELPDLYANASFLLFPQIEDAGIVPLEALASGLPVIAFGEGGILDILRHGENGLLVPKQTVEAFARAVKEARSIQWDRSAIRGTAEKFSYRSFCEKIEKEVLVAHGRVKGRF